MISVDETSASHRVLLVNLNKYDQPYPVYPLGLAYVAGALRNHGLDTKTWDARIPGQTLEECIATYKPNYIGLTLRNIDNVQCHNPKSFIYELLDCCKRVRAVSQATLILGGSGFSVFPKELYELTKVDYGIEGEGEETLPRLIKAVINGSAFDGISGLHYRDSAGEAKHLPRNPSDAIFTAEPYHDPEIMKSYLAEGSLPGVQTQRGCPLKCCYCTYPLIEGRRHRRRPPELAADELADMAARGARYVFIVDSVFNSSPTHVFETCEAILRRGVRIKWGCFLRPQGLTPEQMAIMARAGLSHIEFGSDSFSDTVLEAYHKKLRFEDIRRSAELAAAEKVDQCHFLILGGPGETAATLEETLVNSRQLRDSVVLPIIGMRVYPGTSLQQRAIAEGAITSDTELLEPFHYLAPGLTAEGITSRLAQFVKTDPNWIIGEPPPSFHQLVERLRKRGVVGPLWTYFAMLQRLPTGPVAGGGAPA